MKPTDKENHSCSIYEKQARARAALSQNELEIYFFLKAYWDALGNDFDPDLHEEPAVRQASKRFNITQEAVRQIWGKVDCAGLNFN